MVVVAALVEVVVVAAFVEVALVVVVEPSMRASIVELNSPVMLSMLYKTVSTSVTYMVKLGGVRVFGRESLHGIAIVTRVGEIVGVNTNEADI